MYSYRGQPVTWGPCVLWIGRGLLELLLEPVGTPFDGKFGPIKCAGILKRLDQLSTELRLFLH